MNFYAMRFNLYLLPLLAAMLLLGCQTNKKDEHLASLRIHLENRAQVAGSGQTVSVLRSQPVLVTINTEPVLTEANIIGATVLETPGGYALQVQFDETGTWTLEQYSAANIGKHFAIFGQWSEQSTNSRWLGAPVISHRIANGLLAFTPDASRTEATQLVIGLNNMAKKIAKGKMK
jgi:preprotein translocase subunit SecD